MGKRSKRTASRKLERKICSLVNADFGSYNDAIRKKLLPDRMCLVDISKEVRREYHSRVLSTVETMQATRSKHVRTAKVKSHTAHP